MKNRILFYFSILQKKKGWWIRKPENEKRIALMTKNASTSSLWEILLQ